MAAVRLIDALTDFAPRFAAPAPSPRQDEQRASARTPQIDITSIVAVEVARAETTLRSRLEGEHAALLAAERDAHAAQLAELDARLGGLAGETIGTRLAEMEANVTGQVSATVARIVGALMGEDLRRRSIDSLAASIRAAIADREAVRIQVYGPPSLFEPLAAALAGRAANIDYLESDGFDLRVAIDGNLFETRIAEWSAAVSEILA